jgi:hypothetical protein
MIRRHLLPFFVSAVSLAVAIYEFVAQPLGYSLALSLVGLVGYVVGTDWLLLSLRDVSAARVAGGKYGLLALKLAIGAPTAGLLLVLVVYAAIEGDLAWEAAEYAFIPVLFVWPFVLAAVTGDDGLPRKRESGEPAAR